MKYNGTSWVAIGTAGFSAGEVAYVSLAFDSSDAPYVAYRDAGNSNKSTVMKFNGTSWVTVGTAGFSAGEVHYTSLAFNSNDEPYVAYQDVSNSNKATLMKFDGTNWVTVGTAGFSAVEANYTSIAINSTNEPYVAYRGDVTNSYRATVMKFVDATSSIYNPNAVNNAIAVYPNPTKNQINFSIFTNIQLTNVTGQIIAEKKNVNTLDLSHLSSGMYFLTLSDNKGQILQRNKIVKE